MRIITRLQGGLGNQLFQYAAARSLALRLGTRIEFDLSALNSDKKRRFELCAFRFPSTVRTVSYMDGHRRITVIEWLDRIDVVREKHFEFDAEMEKISPRRSIHLIGYWQTERYFKSAEPQIRSDLEFIQPPDGPNRDMLARIQAVNAVSVHFRRGDYVNEKHTAAFNGVPSLQYYHRAVTEILATCADAKLFVFSDDPQWVRQNFHPPAPVTIVDINTPDQPTADLRLMAACRHHILANSSFSWWGAWLNPDPAKRVFAPNRWFLPDYNTIDLLPSGWRTLEADLAMAWSKS